MAHGKHDLGHDLELSEMAPTGKAFYVPAAGGVMFAWGTAVPSSKSGFAPGCLFIDYNASADSQLHINEGTAESCTFTAIHINA